MLPIVPIGQSSSNRYDLCLIINFSFVKLQEGLAEVIASMEELKDEDKKELVELLDCHFDPEKQAVLPAVKKNKSKRGGKYKQIKTN